MKKIKKQPSKHKNEKTSSTSTQNLLAIQFIEDMQKLSNHTSGKSKLISIKIPENLLRAFKYECEKINTPYQTQIKKIMREWLNKN